VTPSSHTRECGRRRDLDGIDPILAATLSHVERMAREHARARPVSVCGSRTSSRGVAASHRGAAIGHLPQKEAEEGLLPYVPKAYELYVLAALPLVPFLILVLFLGPMLLED